MNPMVLVVIPTVPGREQQLATAVATHDDPAATIHVARGFPSCGAAWNTGGELMMAHMPDVTHIMFSADDLIAHSGWLDAALMCMGRGEIPGAMLYSEDGTRQQDHDGQPNELVGFPRVPIMPRALWQPCPPIHYFSDVWYGDMFAAIGVPIRLTRGYAFTHTWASAGRITDDSADRKVYEGSKA